MEQTLTIRDETSDASADIKISETAYGFAVNWDDPSLDAKNDEVLGVAFEFYDGKRRAHVYFGHANPDYVVDFDERTIR